MKKTFKILYVAAFLFVLVFPLCTLNLKHNVASEFDNKMLAEFPTLGEGFRAGFEEYLRDRIELRKPLIRFYLAMNEKLTGDVSVPNRTLGRDDYLFFKVHENLSYTQFHESFVYGVVKMKEYCEARGAKFYFLFDPEKLSVYRKYLPTYVNYNDEWTDKLIENLKAAGVSCESNRDLLMELSETEQVFNVQYDPGHWNDRGMYYGTNNLWKMIQKDFPEITEYTEDEFDISTINEYYELADPSVTLMETVPWYTIKTSYADLTKKYHGIKIKKEYPFFMYLSHRSSKADQYPKGLIFQGSYYNRKPSFLLGRLKEYYGVHDYQNVMNLDYYFNLFQPDLVVFEAAEYTFSDEYFDRNKMKKIDFNPGLYQKGKNRSESIRDRIAQAEKLQDEPYLSMTTRAGYDRAVLQQPLSDARYCYLLSEDTAYDLKKNAEDLYEADLPLNAFPDSAVLYYEDSAGIKHTGRCHIIRYEEFITGPQLSSGVFYNEDNEIYEFTTDVENNLFTSIELQLYTDGWDYITGLETTQDGSVRIGEYKHEGPDGDYILRLKGNTNLQDEYAYMPIHLVQGKTYFYSYVITAFDEKKIVLQEWSFLEKTDEG